MKELVVQAKYNDKKLSVFLLDHFPNLSQNTLYKALRKKDIKINNNRINKDIIIHTDDNIQIYIKDELLYRSLKLDIIYEDDNILIINKPVNIEVTGTDSLTELVHVKYSSCKFLPMPCHRLDRNTNGLILFAKNKLSLNILIDKFKKHEIIKHYRALVYGIPHPNKAKLESYLFKDQKKSTVYISDTFKPGYKKIVTSYSVLKQYKNNSSLLDIEIETGRTHQIRAHLAYIGHPIIGDGKYGINSINKKFGFKYQQLTSYMLIFNFKSDSGILNYLNNKTFLLYNKKS